MKKFILGIVLLLGINHVEAAEASQVTTISRFISYNQFGGGDVVFRIANPTSSCFGYWISKDDAGFNANLSLILAAYQAKTKIKAYGHTDKKWAGSGNFWCKLYAIEYPG
ncbi:MULTISPECIES: hypothetical protein [unclassified Colwellia]|uniref:hypothetical protein n=1 Tax=unclassified Colwellia TaxID=196834 RepID=UPI0015F44BF9|nr:MULTISPECIES: hypothetical protein [unclassified Colwellia]MBA6233650.1 hypothetical protein [Colwellia sp. MB02u-7]MBA6237288.1 hypothetical protein [Colwellia sp. MB02u-11]MBA6300533.1 hypothetical protein [Colwellia sp. MB3u-22]MBA6311124.1 hypothetical protein [Colwellia sp. MB3u-64]